MSATNPHSFEIRGKKGMPVFKVYIYFCFAIIIVGGIFNALSRF